MLSRRTSTLETVPDGTPGVVAKVKRIRQMVEVAKRDPAFRDRAARIVAHVAEKDHDAEIAALVEHVRRGVRYLRDPWSPVGLELFVEPQTMLRDVDAGHATGDCDDHVLLASALLEVAGYPTRYRVGGVPPDNWQHIWLDVQHPRKGWLPVELTKKDVPIGFDPSPRFPMTKTLGALTMREDALSRELRSKGVDPTFALRTGYGMDRLSASTKAALAQTTQPATAAPSPAAAREQDTRLRQNQMAMRRGGALSLTRKVGGIADLPPSFSNTHPIASSPVPWGSTPMDFLRAVDRGRVDPDALFGLGESAANTFGLGFFKKLKKLHKKANPFAMTKRMLRADPIAKRVFFRKKRRAPGVVQPVPAPGVEYSTQITGPAFPAQQPMPLPGQPLVSIGSGQVMPPSPPAPMPPPVGSYVPTEWDFAQQPGEEFDVPASDDASETYDPEFGQGAGESGPVVYDEQETDMQYGTLGGANWARKIGLGEEPWWSSLLQTAGQAATEIGRQKLIAKGYLKAPPPAIAPAPAPLLVQAPPPPPQIIYRTQAAPKSSPLPLIAAAALAAMLLLKR